MYKTIPEQEQRYIAKGFAKAKGWTMNQFTNKIMTEDEMKRLAKLEILDELEEMQLIQDHYFVLVACNEKYDPETLY